MKCQNCKKRKSVIKYAEEPIFALSHGFGVTELCRQCYINLIENHLKEVRQNLKEQKKLLVQGK